MIVVSELLNDAIRTGFLFCMGIAMVRITWRSELARFTLTGKDPVPLVSVSVSGQIKSYVASTCATTTPLAVP